MPNNPYSHKIEDPMHEKIREKNLDELLNIVAENRVAQEFPEETVEDKVMANIMNMEEEVTRVENIEDIFMEAEQVPAYDEHGEFMEPPVPGYWVNMLERAYKALPEKPPWLEEALLNFKQAKLKIEDLEQRMHAGDI